MFRPQFLAIFWEIVCYFHACGCVSPDLLIKILNPQQPVPSISRQFIPYKLTSSRHSLVQFAVSDLS